MRQERADCGGRSMAAMHFTELGGLRAGDVNFLARQRAVRSGHLQGVRVDEDRVNALGLFEVLDVTVARQSCGAKHKVRPYGCGGSASCKPQVVIVVETNPDHTNQIVGEASEPAVSGSARFSRGRQGEAFSPHLGTGTLVDHVDEDAVDQVGDTWVKHESIYC